MMRRSVCAVLLAAVSLLIVRQVPAADAPSSKRWERAIFAFEAADKASPPPQGAVLFIGSSSIRFWKSLAKDFPQYNVINRGFGGSQIADSTYYADRIVIPYRPSVIILHAGSNDLAAGKTPRQVYDDFRDVRRKGARGDAGDADRLYLDQSDARAVGAGRKTERDERLDQALHRVGRSARVYQHLGRDSSVRTGSRGPICTSRTACIRTPPATRFAPRSSTSISRR